MLAQKFNGFYIEPKVNWKVYTTLASNLEPTIETPYFKIEQKQYIPPSTFSPLLLGLDLGYSFKNNNKIQIGISQDEIVQGINLTGLAKVQNKNPDDYAYTKFSTYGGPSCLNLSLLYKINILNIKSQYFKEGRFVQVHLNLGITYFHKPDNGVELMSTSGWSYMSLDSTFVNVAVEPYNWPVDFKHSFKYNLGFDITFGKNDKEWFNLNFAFISNNSRGPVYSISNVQIDTENKSDKKRYYFDVKGTGNGIYFGISKRIYPVKIYHNRMAKRMAKLKG
jgi:hypothetical protein